MITWNETADLLKLCAVYDQRTVGEEDIKGWLLAAKLAGWTMPLAERIIVEHYATDSDRPRIDPARISDRIRDVRRRAACSFEAPRIPEGLDNDTRAYRDYYRAQLAGHIDGLLARWAAGEELPPGVTYERRELQTPASAEQRRAIEEFAKRRALPQ